MAPALPFVAALLLGLTAAQTPGKSPEVHPRLQTWKCTNRGGCVPQNGAVVLDDLAHPVHQLDDPSLNCGNWGSAPNATVCPTAAECAKNCIVEGISDYADYGITTDGSSITMKMFNAAGDDVSPRAYLLEENGLDYELVQLTGNEIAFDVDVSELPCGMNAALYLTEMSQTGGRSALNPGGATYGTGYCDAQCYTYPFVNGVGNIDAYGACCNEMDLWEANGEATALTPHPCSVDGPYGCSGSACGSTGVCDKNGCGFNPYALGDQSYYGPGLTVDTSKPFTVTTQFVTNDGTKTGTLTEIRRSYTQNGKVIANAVASASSGFSGQSSITESFCTAMDSEAGTLGGLTTMGEALGRGMVLIFSIWNDAGGYMNWLDSGSSGPCSSTAGIPSTIQANDPGTSVTFSNIKWGDIGSTGSGTGGSSSSSSSTTTSPKTTSTTTTSATTKTSATTTTTSIGATQTHYGQCGGMYYTGPTVCVSPYTCQVQNPYYSQCL